MYKNLIDLVEINNKKINLNISVSMRSDKVKKKLEISKIILN